MLNRAYPRNGAFASPLSHAASRPFGLPELTDEEIVARDKMRAQEEELSRLSSLSPAEYGKRREVLSEELEIGLGWLDKEYDERRKDAKRRAGEERPQFLMSPEPWPEPVDGSELLLGLVIIVRRHVVMSAHAALATALWVIHTHSMECSSISPILAIESPEKRCGKTTLLSILRHLVCKALTASNLTGPATYRVVEAFAPTLLLDEADTFLTDEKSELRGILNSSHSRTAAFVPRCVGDSRNADLDELCRKTARWADDNSYVLRECDPVVPNDLDDRAADNWRVLLAIAEAVGPSWAEKARAAASVLSGKRDESEETPGVMLLRDSRGILNERVPFLSPSRLVEELVKIEEAPWSEWRNGKPISAKGVANLLKPYGLRSELDREDKVPGRRYYRDKFKPAWERYLPEDPQKSVATVASVTSPVNSGNFR